MSELKLLFMLILEHPSIILVGWAIRRDDKVDYRSVRHLVGTFMTAEERSSLFHI
jgi:hypothetical protein